MENQQEQQTQEETPKEESPNMIAVLSYVGILVIIPLLVAKDDEFVKYHVKQGLVLLIAWILVSFIPIINFIGWIVGIVFMIIGIVNVVGGKKKQLPLIGQLADKFKI